MEHGAAAAGIHGNEWQRLEKPVWPIPLDRRPGQNRRHKSAVIDDQYGDGAEHATVSMTGYNPSDETNSNYTYYGADRATGWAFYDPGERWHIFDMDCPGDSMVTPWLYLSTLFSAGWFYCRCNPYDPPPCSELHGR